MEDLATQNAARPCCANCVFLYKDTLGTVDWEHNEQVVIGNYCVLQDFEINGCELRVVSEGERMTHEKCAAWEAAPFTFSLRSFMEKRKEI